MSYSPTLGRWLERDPAGYVDGSNLYEYAVGNAARFTDPLGLEALPEGVNPPTDGQIGGPIGNQIGDLIEQERQKLLQDLQNSPVDSQRKQLDDLRSRQKSYNCVLKVSSVSFVGTYQHTQTDVVSQSVQGTVNPIKIIEETTTALDRFRVIGKLECNCGVKGGDVNYTVDVPRDKKSKELGRYGGGPLPKPIEKPINEPPGGIDVKPPKFPITIRPGG